MTEWYVRPLAPDRLTQLKRIGALAAVLVAVGVGIAVVPALTRGTAETVVPVEAVDAGVPSAVVFVHVVGEVVTPGIVELPAGARVTDALDKAGGLTAAADSASINLARIVTDGEQIVVARRGATSASAGMVGGKVSINRADVDALDSLPGIGPAIAGRIVDYREAHGPFTSIEAIDSVPGIGAALLEGIRDLVTL